MKCKILKLYTFQYFKIYNQLAVNNSVRCIFYTGKRAVPQLVEALSYKPESHEFGS